MSPDPAANPFEDVRTAEAYDPWYAEQLGATVDRLQKDLVLRMARPLPGERALDVGTGTGNYACALAARGLEVTGIDPSEAMLAVARLKPQPVTWLQAAAECLPCEDDSFDLVVSVTALEFVADPRRALQEMFRVLRPGGRLVVGTLNARGPWGKLYTRLGQDPASPFHFATLYTAKRFEALLAVHGDVRWSSAVFVPPSGRGLAVAGLLEHLGRALRRDRGALLVGRVDK
ncbi:MAG: class I SAM-dependent methyltransferase [Anaerolineae bacterium]